MSRLAKLQYRMAILDRYRQAGRQEKARILSEFCSVCGDNRKYAIRRLNSPPLTNHDLPHSPVANGVSSYRIESLRELLAVICLANIFYADLSDRAHVRSMDCRFITRFCQTYHCSIQETLPKCGVVRKTSQRTAQFFTDFRFRP